MQNVYYSGATRMEGEQGNQNQNDIMLKYTKTKSKPKNTFLSVKLLRYDERNESLFSTAGSI